MTKSVLFVCLGNICRSPLAEGIAQRIAQEQNLDIIIDSCGTGDWNVGKAPCSGAQRIAKERGLDISHIRARQVTTDDLEAFELIIAFDAKNLCELKAMGAKNVRKLGEYGYNNEDVPDPYFFPGYEGFDRVYEMIDQCVTNLFAGHIV